MSTIIPFRQRQAGQLPVPTVDPADARPDRLRSTQVNTDQAGEVERHWGVAVALASWPLCLGASVVLATL